MPGCSVLMPMYNAEPFVDEAIESILSQTYRDFVLLVIDDGSVDKSANCVRKHAARDRRIHFVSRHNRGVVFTRNELMEMAGTELIAWMDSDDVAYPDRLARQIEAMSSRGLVAVGSQVRYIDECGRPIGSHSLPLTHEEIDQVHMSGFGHAMAQPATMVSRKAMKSIGLMSSAHVAEDIDVWLKLAERGRLENLPEVLLDYRLHASSYGHRNRSAQAESGWLAAAAAAQRRGCEAPAKPVDRRLEHVSLAKLYSKWAWWALKSGNVRTARHYARKQLVRRPVSMRSWKLMACTIRGR